MIVSIFIENRKLDIFPQDNIEVVSSIADTSDITKNTTDFSKSFSVPASDNNNNIFRHYYNADVDNTFDARIKKDARIELDGLPFKDGKIKLEKVIVKSGKPSSYAIRFFGKLVSMKDKIKEDELPDLDLSDLNFSYESNNIITGLQSGLYDGKIICTLLTQKRLIYNSDPSDTTNTPTVTNIANVGLPLSFIKPSIKLIEIIKAIETKYDILFSRDFLDRSEFQNLYLWLNNKDTDRIAETQQLINWTSVSGTDLGLSTSTDTWTGSTFFEDGLSFRTFKYRLTITSSTLLPYSIVVKNNGNEIARIDVASGNFTTDFLFITSQANTPFSYQFFIATTNTMSYSASITIERRTGAFPIPLTATQTGTASTVVLNAEFVVSANLPKIKVIDFIKSLGLLFKWVIIQDNDTDIYLNTLNDYYSQGRLFEVTKYIDFASTDVEPGKLLNEIDFTFENPTTILNKQFKMNNRLGYGDEDLKLADEDGNLLDGEKLEVRPKVEQMIYERLIDLNTGGLTNIMYGLSADENLNPQNPLSHIFYNNVVNVTDKPFKVLRFNGATNTISGNLNTASHTLGFSSPQYATIFSEEFNEWDGSLISNNLYTNYWKDYINSIFNIKRRNFSFRSFLPLNILLALKLNDVLKIESSYYRIDRMTTNLITREVNLNLINAFDTVINPFSATETIIFSDAKSTSESVFVKGSKTFSAILSDDDWASVTIDGRNVLIDMEANNSGVDRTTILTISSDGENDIVIPIFQQAQTVRVDTTAITADSTLITADNGNN